MSLSRNQLATISAAAVLMMNAAHAWSDDGSSLKILPGSPAKLANVNPENEHLPEVTSQGDNQTPTAPWLTLPPDTPLRVTCFDGRQLQGHYDRRSTGQVLWLSSRIGSSASVASLIDAAQIQRIEQGISAEVIHVTSAHSPTQHFSIPQSVAKSLSVAMGPANVDADAVIDGIDLWLSPRDLVGRPLVKAGMVSVRLDIYSVDVHDQVILRQSETWSHRLSHAHSTFAGMHLRLPFRKVDLSRNASQRLVGIASVTLRVPGEGALHARSNYVPFQP